MRNEAQDLMILANAFFKELLITNCEYGGIGLDCKRPFGNSDVEGDMLELLECEPEGDDGETECYSSKQREYVSQLYHEKLIPFLREQWELKVSNIK
jgi:hypothetical protein